MAAGGERLRDGEDEDRDREREREREEWESSGRGGGLSRVLREHKARIYIIRRCVVMLLCCHD